MNPIKLVLFDLDNTLHQADAGIFACINRRMTDFIATQLNLPPAEASRLREHYWHTYGATLHGLRLHHGIAPETFLRHSHPLDEILPLLQPMSDTETALHTIGQRKAILSNAPQFYIQAIVKALKIEHHFSDFIGIDDLDYHQKPQITAYQRACQRCRIPPEQSILIDDTLANLIAAKQLGIRTVWFGTHATAHRHIDATAHNMQQLAQLPFFHNQTS